MGQCPLFAARFGNAYFRFVVKSSLSANSADVQISAQKRHFGDGA